MRAKYHLRKLPGIAEFEARLQRIAAHPNPNWAPDVTGFSDHYGRLTKRLFGVVFEIDDPVFTAPAPSNRQVRMFEEDLGWDVRDADGKPLLTFYWLAFPIATVAAGKAGRLPGAAISDEDAEAEAADWGAQLLAGAEADRGR